MWYIDVAIHACGATMQLTISACSGIDMRKNMVIECINLCIINYTQLFEFGFASLE